MKTSKIVFVMGVSGSGKTLIGKFLAEEIGAFFIDADDYHPEENIEKMSQGIPLEDIDRWPWLERLNQVAVEHLEKGCVIACSALKESYRERLSMNVEAQWVYLKGTYDEIFKRMQKREGHFMSPKMLKSQFDTLEEPSDAIEISTDDSPEIIVKRIKSELKK